MMNKYSVLFLTLILTSNLFCQVKPVKSFSAKGIMSPEKYPNIRLVPFYILKDTRYVVYFHLKGSVN